ncbi:hypothetical protein VNO77_03752 [Canavalia gladiata]|uniref:Uncharacterized protein n=1 Tax=Canavalia gladiata TaxID=3824 RepID=A0AAN9N0E3_CANGL
MTSLSHCIPSSQRPLLIFVCFYFSSSSRLSWSDDQTTSEREFPRGVLNAQVLDARLSFTPTPLYRPTVSSVSALDIPWSCSLSLTGDASNT